MGDWELVNFILHTLEREVEPLTLTVTLTGGFAAKYKIAERGK